MTDLRNPIAKARDEYLEKFAALDGAPSGRFLRNRIEAAFLAGWVAAEKFAAKPAEPAPQTCATCGGVGTVHNPFADNAKSPCPTCRPSCGTCGGTKFVLMPLSKDHPSHVWDGTGLAPTVPCPDCKPLPKRGGK